MTALVTLHGAQLGHGAQAVLHDVNLHIAVGEKVALVGPSGAGKSTLLTEIHRRLGDDVALCPQQLGLVDPLSVYHNIYMARLEHRPFLLNLWNLFFPLPQARREVAELAEPLGLGALLYKSVNRLSGGERQRVALARACYRGKSVFIGDELVSSLDPEQGEALLAQICSRHETVIVALHSPRLALSGFERVIGLRNGRVCLDAPAHSLSADFLAGFYRGE